MRLNMPVTQREYPLRDGIAIISKTDAKGRITHVNQDFVESCGYSEAELLGQPHNVLRHPDMPAEAFRDLWETVQAGRPWSGLVKNRRKDGDHYWVRASVTPLADGGYMSVRQKPGRDEVQRAENLYRDMRAGPSKARMYRGVVYAGGPGLALARFFGNLRISHKLWGMSAFALLLLVLLGGTAIHMVERDMASLKSVYEDRAVPLRDLARMQDLLQENASEVLRGYQHAPGSPAASLHTHPASLHLDRIEQNRQAIDGLWKAYMATTLTEEERKLAEAFFAKRKEYVQGYLMPAAEQIRNGQYDLAPLDAFLRSDQGAGAEARQLLGKLLQLQADVAKTEYEGAVGRYRLVSGLTVGGVAFAALALLYFAWLQVRAITRPLRATSDAALAIASGDVTATLPAGRGDEIGDMVVQLTRMRDNLFEMVYGIRRNAEALGLAAQELTQSAYIAAHSAGQQSESASGMAAAVEQLSVSIDQVGEHAREALEISRHSGEASRQGGEVVLQAADRMRAIAGAVTDSAGTIRELEAYSDEISAIVGVIKDIADQTNLLALNAAIEAARAGEQGRGFAVVADEVRKLAERTGNSTQQITAMVERIQAGARKAVAEMETSVEHVSEGVGTAQQAGESIVGIQEGTGRVVHSVNDIALALREQSVATQDIAQNVEKIAQVCEENSAVAQQTSASAQILNELAGALRLQAGRFKV